MGIRVPRNLGFWSWCPAKTGYVRLGSLYVHCIQTCIYTYISGLPVNGNSDIRLVASGGIRFGPASEVRMGVSQNNLLAIPDEDPLNPVMNHMGIPQN